MRNILVPIDDSPQRDAVLDAVVDLHRSLRAADVHLLHCVTAPAPTATTALFGNEVRWDALEARARGHLDQAAAYLGEAGVPCTPHLSTGAAPADAIVDHAARLGVDAIVMGARARGALASLVLGSVSSAVLTRCRLPVWIIR